MSSQPPLLLRRGGGAVRAVLWPRQMPSIELPRVLGRYTSETGPQPGMPSMCLPMASQRSCAIWASPALLQRWSMRFVAHR